MQKRFNEYSDDEVEVNSFVQGSVDSLVGENIIRNSDDEYSPPLHIKQKLNIKKHKNKNLIQDSSEDGDNNKENYFNPI